MAYSFTVSYAILFVMDAIPGLNIRVESRVELGGLDASQMGEFVFEGITLTSEQRSQPISNLVKETIQQDVIGMKVAKSDIEKKKF